MSQSITPDSENGFIRIGNRVIVCPASAQYDDLPKESQSKISRAEFDRYREFLEWLNQYFTQKVASDE